MCKCQGARHIAVQIEEPKGQPREHRGDKAANRSQRTKERVARAIELDVDEWAGIAFESDGRFGKLKGLRTVMPVAHHQEWQDVDVIVDERNLPAYRFKGVSCDIEARQRSRSQEHSAKRADPRLRLVRSARDNGFARSIGFGATHDCSVPPDHSFIERGEWNK